MEKFGITDTEKEILRQIAFFKNQKMNYDEIADQLNARMSLSKIGRKWNYHLIRNIVRGDAYRAMEERR